MGQHVNVPTDKHITETLSHMAWIALRYGTDLIVSEADAQRLIAYQGYGPPPMAGDEGFIFGCKAYITA
jgi:hypothetical protein